jgi:hypothetical protein
MVMPSMNAKRKAQSDRRAGKSPGTQAGEFVKEEIEHVREGKHGARSSKQAIAIGLSKARRAGVELSPPKKGKTSEQTRRKAARDMEKGHGAAPRQTVTAKRKSASKQALRREGSAAGSRAALSSQARTAARRRSPSERSASARKAARTREMHAHA